MCKRLAAMCLCAILLVSLALPAGAQETLRYMNYTVSNLESFLDLAEKCRLDSYSRNLKVTLLMDLDLTNTDFSGVPVFSGIFEGNGHTIKGLSLTAAGSAQGLFRYLTETALVQDLNLIGTVKPGGSRSEVGGIAGENWGRIVNCTVTGTVSGSEYVGGIAGKNSISGIVENCRMNGNVYGTHFVGGLVGENGGVIRGCENNAKVNDTAVENTVTLSDITLNSLTTSESVNTVTDIGGIAGSSMGVIRECVNRTDVGYQHMGYNIGGIAGTQSGLILDCENYGQIQGRKEVGGIVGQMEPTARIEYEEDALQILRRQLNSMAGVVGTTVSNVQGTGDAIIAQVGTLQTQMFNARDAVDTLIPDKENPQLPDLDTIQAAQNTISSSISGMSQTLQGMSATTYSAMGTLSNNLYSLKGQIDAMRTTLGNVSETLGGSLTDVSDGDTEDNLMGKVTQCRNLGKVQADRNAGGIVGAIAMENDLDPEEDWKISGDNSLNFESELRAVVLGCTNNAQVTCKKQNGGGIVGWQSMGLVKACLSSGTVDAAGADYVGGISGQSTGFIRENGAKCEISGANMVGGIAGSATIVSDCRSMVILDTNGEKNGAVLGTREEPAKEEEAPISGNFYFPTKKDRGGIDGISYEGQAQPLSQRDFLQLENLAQMFTTVTVCFQYGGGQQRSFEVPLGGKLSMDWIPPIPPRSGSLAAWAGLAEEDLEEIYFDRTYEVQYTSKNTVLQSDVLRGKRPLMLAQGIFSEDAALTVAEAEDALPMEKGNILREVWHFSISGMEVLDSVRFSLPEGMASDQACVHIQGLDGAWQEVITETDGTYLVIPLKAGDQGIALIETPARSWLLPAGAGAVLILLLGVIWFRKRRRGA